MVRYGSYLVWYGMVWYDMVLYRWYRTVGIFFEIRMALVRTIILLWFGTRTILPYRGTIWCIVLVRKFAAFFLNFCRFPDRHLILICIKKVHGAIEHADPHSLP